MKKVAVLVSGGGSNLQTIIDAINAGKIPAQICVVIASKPGVYALNRAEAAGIPSRVISRKSFEDKQQFDDAILECVMSYNADYIVLAGYLSILGTEIIKRYRNKIINIHPSLIPSFCGMGFYGHRVHQAVIDYGAKISGATVHFVDEEADTGAIIMQEAVPVMDDDNADTLADRVLKVEHKLLPYALELLVTDRLVINNRRVSIK